MSVDGRKDSMTNLKQRIGKRWRGWLDGMVGRIWRRILRRAIWKAAHEIIAVGQSNGACQIHLNAAKDELYRASAALDSEDSPKS